MNDEERILILGALLHDIGKFLQRTHELTDKGKFEKNHELYGEKACEGLKLDPVIGLMAYAHGKEHWKALKEHVMEKGLKFSPEEFSEIKHIAKIISDADKLDAQQRIPKDRYQLVWQHQISIFSNINIEKGNCLTDVKYASFGPLSIDQILFPERKEVSIKESRNEYNILWNKFINEFNNLPKEKSAFITSLYYLLFKYTFLIPSAPGTSVPDISLFEHLKNTCAIAVCLYKTGGDDKFLLLGGDISGIQRFIYTITSKGAAKSLRGRSLYLELLNEVIAKYILKDLGLPITNLLYCGGGNFYILIPKTEEENLSKLRKRIEKKILKFHKGDIHIVIDWIQLSGKDLKRGMFGKKLRELIDKIDVAKKKKFSNILYENYEDIFGPVDKGEREVCDSCQSEGKLEEDNEGHKFCELCKSFIDLNKEVKKSKYMIEIWNDKDGRDIKKGSWKEIIYKFGCKIRFLSDLNSLGKVKYREMVIYSLNTTNFLNKETLSIKNASLGFKFLPILIPTHDEDILDKNISKGDIKSTDHLAEDAEGIKRIGILRMDVDDLGKIFAKGLGKNATISRISTLSSMLSVFFEGYIPYYIENKEEYKNKIYIVYAGGDDSFIIGPWNLILDLSYDIYKEFRRFTCENPNITISAGITIVNPKFPIYKCADLAGEALDEKAKIERKNKICLFDVALPWNISGDSDFERTIKLKDILINALDNGCPKALLYKVYEGYLEFKRFEKYAKERDIHVFRLWRLLYYLKRFRKMYEKARDKLDEIENEYKDILWDKVELNPIGEGKMEVKTEYKSEIIPIAVKWVELLRRGE